MYIYSHIDTLAQDSSSCTPIIFPLLKYVIILCRVGGMYMAKRGRPSKKVMKRRKELKRKSQKILFFAILLLIAMGILMYFSVVKGV